MNKHTHTHMQNLPPDFTLQSADGQVFFSAARSYAL